MKCPIYIFICSKTILYVKCQTSSSRFILISCFNYNFMRNIVATQKKILNRFMSILQKNNNLQQMYKPPGSLVNYSNQLSKSRSKPPLATHVRTEDRSNHWAEPHFPRLTFAFRSPLADNCLRTIDWLTIIAPDTWSKWPDTSSKSPHQNPPHPTPFL